VPVTPGDVSTYGGAVTDVNARVLKAMVRRSPPLCHRRIDRFSHGPRLSRRGRQHRPFLHFRLCRGQTCRRSGKPDRLSRTGGTSNLSLPRAGTGSTPPDFPGNVGPYWTKGEGAEAVIGFIAGKSTPTSTSARAWRRADDFADVALGHNVVRLLGAPNCATAQLQLHFVSTARLGEFVSCRAELVRQSSSLIFMRGLICAGGRTVASADGIWKVLEPKPR